MTNDFTRQAEDMLKAAQEARLPDGVKQMAEQGVAKTREAVTQMTAAAAENAKTAEHMLIAYQAGAKSIGDRVLENVKTNSDAAFDAASQMLRAKTLPEMFQLQAQFAQRQFAAFGSQSQELVQLSTKVAQATYQHVGAAAQKSFDTLKKTG